MVKPAFASNEQMLHFPYYFQRALLSLFGVKDYAIIGGLL